MERIEKIALLFFVESINDENRQKFEKNHLDNDSGVFVETIFIESGDG